MSAPFSLFLLMAILTQVGAIQTTPVFIAVATSFLTISGFEYIVSQRRTDSEPTPTGNGS